MKLTRSLDSVIGKYPEMPKVSLTWRVSTEVNVPSKASVFLQLTFYLLILCFYKLGLIYQIRPLGILKDWLEDFPESLSKQKACG